MVYSTYQNGDDWGMVYPKYPKNWSRHLQFTKNWNSSRAHFADGLHTCRMPHWKSSSQANSFGDAQLKIKLKYCTLCFQPKILHVNHKPAFLNIYFLPNRYWNMLKTSEKRVWTLETHKVRTFWGMVPNWVTAISPTSLVHKQQSHQHGNRHQNMDPPLRTIHSGENLRRWCGALPGNRKGWHSGAVADGYRIRSRGNLLMLCWSGL